jgi:L-threonylcarbamoyladenylate synthase
VREQLPATTRVLIPASENGLEAAAAALRAGRLVAFPTDTFFALGASALDAAAVGRIFKAKGRADGNPVPVLVSSIKDAGMVAASFPYAAAALAKKFWPGALTLVLPARPEVPAEVTAGGSTVGVRVPAHDLARHLISLAGIPVTGTSANISGRPPCKTAGEVLEQLDGRVDHILDAPCGSHTAPSTVVDFASGRMRLIREGAIAYDRLQAVVDAL